MRINNLTIDNHQKITLNNLIIIVGSNGTGKTRLIEELHFELTQRSHGNIKKYWNLQFEYSLEEADIKEWLSSLMLHLESTHKTWLSPYTIWQNQIDGLSIPDSQYQVYLNSKESLLPRFNNPNFIKEYVNYLQVGARLSVNASAEIKGGGQKVGDVLNLLFRNGNMLSEISESLKLLFKKKIVLALHAFPILELKIVDDTVPEPKDFDIKNTALSLQEYINWKEVNGVGEVWVEGHGILAFLHIMLSYYIPLNHVLLIDEPEIHLYPSVKRKFGNTLGEMSKKKKKQFFCVTHDSDFLQGVFDSRCPVTIIKIKKANKKREIVFKNYDHSYGYLAGQNQTPFLQIPFLDAALIVEGASDRLVYESVFYDNGFLGDLEYKFISAGGKDSINNPLRVAEDLKVPYAIILDIDALKENENSSLMNILGVRKNSEHEKELRELGPNLKGIENFSLNGIMAIKDNLLKDRVNKFIGSLKKIGIFVVHKGSLESWKDIKVESKNKFPEAFVAEYKKNKKGFSQLVAFLQEVDAYIRGQVSKE
jgi:AAA15 family ATPase/GTPase